MSSIYKCSVCGNLGCKVEVSQLFAAPHDCLYKNRNIKADWREFEYETLTAAVFEREYCASWVKYAAVTPGGCLVFFEEQPEYDNQAWVAKKGQFNVIRGAYFDASNWQNSLIERPEKKAELPDWCKVGEWCFCLDDDGKDKYFKITRFDDEFIYGDDWDIAYPFAKQARLRPWTFEEAPAILKVKNNDDCMILLATLQCVEDADKWLKCSEDAEIWCYLITGCGRRNDYKISFDALSKYNTQLDGSPCGVLEHRTDTGEWVQ